MDDDEIDAMLAELADDEAPLRPALRAAILDGLPPSRTQARRRWSLPLWGTPAAAALCGLWLGAAQPGLLLDGLAGLGFETTIAEVALLDAALTGLEDWP